jgi:hypothetical protein
METVKERVWLGDEFGSKGDMMVSSCDDQIVVKADGAKGRQCAQGRKQITRKDHLDKIVIFEFQLQDGSGGDNGTMYFGLNEYLTD